MSLRQQQSGLVAELDQEDPRGRGVTPQRSAPVLSVSFAVSAQPEWMSKNCRSGNHEFKSSAHPIGNQALSETAIPCAWLAPSRRIRPRYVPGLSKGPVAVSQRGSAVIWRLPRHFCPIVLLWRPIYAHNVDTQKNLLSPYTNLGGYGVYGSEDCV